MVNEKTIYPSLIIFLIAMISLSSANLGLNAAINGDVNLSTGEVVEIRINAEQAKNTVEARIGTCDNCSVQLVEINVKGETKASYEVTANRPVRFLGIFKMNSKIVTNVDAETGTVISVNKPWWAFLSVDSESRVGYANQSANANENANVAIENRMENRPIGEWCVKGQTYAVSQEGSSSNTVIEGVVSYKGEQRCKGISKTTIQVPGGYSADIEAITTYYFNEGGEDVWVVSNVNGQTTEVHVTNK